jgi:chemotaxis protein methyltransferase CheR
LLSTQDEEKCLSILENRLGLTIAKVRSINYSIILNKISCSFESTIDFLSFIENGSIKLHLFQELIKELTIGETFFFRNFSVIDKTILPDLIKKNQEKKTLKIWCAGCSTGEEAYSLAISLAEKKILPSEWDIQLYATDLSQSSIVKAEEGIYSEWSFRGLSERLKDKYFQKNNNEYTLKNEIKTYVHFRVQNLAELNFPNQLDNYYEFDLILCRNVMIYFSLKLIEKLSTHFYNSLKKNSYLVVGAAEPTHTFFSNFNIEINNDAVIFQKSFEKIAGPQNNIKLNTQNSYEKALKYYKLKDYEHSKSILTDFLLENDGNIETHYLIALIEASQQHFSDVKYFCNKIFKLDSNFPYSYYLMGLVLKEEANYKKAEYYFKHSYKLARNFFQAGLELAQIYIIEEKQNELKNLIDELYSRVSYYDDNEMSGLINTLSIYEVKKALLELKEKV